MGSCGTHLRPISQKVLKKSIHELSLKSAHFPGAIELMMRMINIGDDSNGDNAIDEDGNEDDDEMMRMIIISVAVNYRYRRYKSI